jgi:hypothetical protein
VEEAALSKRLSQLFALLKLLVHEFTSALDTQSEGILQDALDKAAAGETFAFSRSQPFAELHY